jgi:hypothetical protein
MLRATSLVTAVAVVALAVCSPADAARLHWSTPTLIDTQITQTDGVFIPSLACPSTTLCVAGDFNGNLLVSSNPGGGRQAWTRTLIDQAPAAENGLTSLACPSVTMCVFGDFSGAILTGNPSQSAATWTRTKTDTTEVSGMACPSTTFCVAVDHLGNVLTTTNPSGGPWNAANIDGTGFLEGVSCPTATFCAAVDANGNAFTSTNPAGGAAQWTKAHIDNSLRNDLFAISCPTPTLCVAVDKDGNVVTSANPTAGPASWSVTPVSSGALRTVACVSPSLCVAGGDKAYVSTNPTGGATAWSGGHGDAVYGLASDLVTVACASPALCVGGDADGFVVTSTDAATGNDWTGAQIDGTPTVFGVSCPRRTLCFADDDSGNVLISRNPAHAWRAVDVGATQNSAQLYGITCPTASLCVAPADFAPFGTSGSGGYGLVSTNPTGPAKSWKAFDFLDGVDRVVHGFFAAGCTTASLCAVMQDDGLLSVSTHPTKPKSWPTPGARKGQRVGVFCPARGRCVAPAGSCPTRSLCVDLNTAGDGTGDGWIAVSTNPARGAKTWHSANVDSGNRLTGVSCPTTKLCVAVDDAGRVLVSTHPAGGTHAWQPTAVDTAALEAISCPSKAFCLAVDNAGQEVIGTA